MSATAQSVKITVAEVEFSGNNPLSDDVRAQLVSDIQRLNISVAQQEDDSDWLAEVEAPIREELEALGYFCAVTTINPYLIRAEAHERHYIARVEIESGPQYRFGEIKFSGETVFTAAELRDQFPLHHGELFAASKIRQGMESMTRLYSGKGFIDQVPEPDTYIDNKSRLIDVLIKVDEGKQYRVGTVETYGLDTKTEQLLKSQLEPGQVFDSTSLRKFFKEHKATLPAEVSPDDALQVRRDETNATVDLVVDFRPCSKT